MARMIENESKMQKEYTVLSYDGDRQRMAKISCLQRWMQDAADAHCTHFGCDYLTLNEKLRAVFVLVRSSLNIIKPITLENTYSVTTWSKGYRGAQFYRDFCFQDKDGQVCAVCGTAWAVMDPVTHRLRRPADLNFPIKECHDEVQGVRLEKLVMPELQYVGDKIVRYTEIDANDHLTNWVYADIITNFLPSMEGKRIAEMDMTYVSEAYENEVIKIFLAQKDGAYFMRGEHPRGRCFEARCRLEDIK